MVITPRNGKGPANDFRAVAIRPFGSRALDPVEATERRGDSRHPCAQTVAGFGFPASSPYSWIALVTCAFISSPSSASAATVACAIQ